MDKKTVLLLVLAALAGSVVGYAASLSTIYALRAKVGELELKLNPGYVQRIKERGVLIVGTSADWPPYEYIDSAGNIVGIDVELAKRIAQELGVKLEIRDMKFAALIEALRAGQIDLIIAGMTPTAERMKVIDFSIPYSYSRGKAIVVLKDTAVVFKSVEDLYGRKIGVQLGTTEEQWAKSTLGGKAEIVSYDRVYPEMLMALQNGYVDAVVLGDTVATAITRKMPELVIAFYAGAPKPEAAVALPQGAWDLKYVVNKVIEQLLETSEMQKIFESETLKWLESGG